MAITASPNINYLWANLMIEELVRNGVESFFISSGSRSSPLTLAVATHPKAKAMIHFDERGSAYRALGTISATKKPCVVITTSGTAAANVFPAVIEASKKKVPLIILTADRPPELRWTGAHQTIDQQKIYGDYVRWFFDMPCPTEEIAPEFVLTTIDQAIARSQGNLKGPVHINCMYREPLAPVNSQTDFTSYIKSIQNWQANNSVYTKHVIPQSSLQPSNINEITQKVGQIQSGIIVVGKLQNITEQKNVLNLAEKLNWPVFADISSGLRLGNKHKSIIHNFDQILLSDIFQNSHKPDGFLHLGGRITSKRWYEYVEKATPQHYIMAINHPLRNDPLHNVTTRIQCDIGQLADALIKHIPKRNDNTLLIQLQKLNTCVDQTVERFFGKQTEINEPQTARLISELILPLSGLFVSSSMPIRDLDMYGKAHHNTVDFGSNRGASGIDGTIATDIGFSTGLNKPTTLLIGDLAFLHDLNSLAMIKDLTHPMVIVVINNNGGGIFSFLPIHKIKQHFEKYFGTPHHLKFQAAAQLFDLNYVEAQTVEDFARSYKTALKGGTATLIEIQIDRERNLKIHEQLQNLIKNDIQNLLNNKTTELNHEKRHIESQNSKVGTSQTV